MSLNAMSSSQYGSLPSASDYASSAGKYGSPLSGSSTTYGSIGSKTAWQSNAAAGSTGVAAYSKRTKGSTLSWDDDNSGPNLPTSDPGSPYALNRG